MTPRAVVLARGLGTRMREPDPAVSLSPEQERAAAAGLKAMIPVNGRPFLDYLLSALADARVRHVALVVAPDHDEIRRYYTDTAPPARVSVSFVVQPAPLGTANAILTAELWTAGEPFLAMNADNLYPVEALARLAELDEPGLPAFDRDDLVSTSNIPPERIRAFALIEIGPDGYLKRIVEKPGTDLPPKGGSHPFGSRGHPFDSRGFRLQAEDRESEDPRSFRLQAEEQPSDRAFISMNCWRFDARIFAACRDVPRSPRGEYEVPEAVGLAVSRGIRFRTFPARGPVLDMSRRADAADVAARLAGITPRL